MYICTQHRGVEQLVARRAHNPKVVGSSPAPATKKPTKTSGFFMYISIGNPKLFATNIYLLSYIPFELHNYLMINHKEYKY